MLKSVLGKTSLHYSPGIITIPGDFLFNQKNIEDFYGKSQKSSIKSAGLVL